MKLSSVVRAFGSLCLLVAEGFPVSMDIHPKIIGPGDVQIQAHPGEHLVLHCEAFSNCGDGLTMIYWLVNGSFPEDTPSSSRIIESAESNFNEGTILQRSLLLGNVTSEDFQSTFTCVVMNGAGMALKNITLATNSSNCNAEKTVTQLL